MSRTLPPALLLALALALPACTPRPPAADLGEAAEMPPGAGAAAPEPATEPPESPPAPENPAPETPAETVAAPAVAPAVDFAADLRPILEANCRPCHFGGGKMYDRLPFDRPETIRSLGTKLFTRIRDEGEQALFRAFLAQEGREGPGG